MEVNAIGYACACPDNMVLLNGKQCEASGKCCTVVDVNSAQLLLLLYVHNATQVTEKDADLLKGRGYSSSMTCILPLCMVQLTFYKCWLYVISFGVCAIKATNSLS